MILEAQPVAKGYRWKVGEAGNIAIMEARAEAHTVRREAQSVYGHGRRMVVFGTPHLQLLLSRWVGDECRIACVVDCLAKHFETQFLMYAL